MHPTTALPLVLAAAALAGCEQEEPIVSYTAPKDPPARRATAPRDPAEATAIEWTVPAGWRVQTGRRFMRYATLEAGTDAEFVEVAVTRLDGAGGPRLDNINSIMQAMGYRLKPQKVQEPVGWGSRHTCGETVTTHVTINHRAQ